MTKDWGGEGGGGVMGGVLGLSCSTDQKENFTYEKNTFQKSIFFGGGKNH